MTTSQHTPSPWTINGFTRIEGDNKLIAQIQLPQNTSFSSKEPSQKEAEANAYLIAAAPELLEALELAEQQLQIAYEIENNAHGHDTLDLSPRGEKLLRALVRTKQAIANARGEG